MEKCGIELSDGKSCPNEGIHELSVHWGEFTSSVCMCEKHYNDLTNPVPAVSISSMGMSDHCRHCNDKINLISTDLIQPFRWLDNLGLAVGFISIGVLILMLIYVIVKSV